MHLVDTTMFFSARSGGVKRYLLAKHEWLTRCKAVRHTLLVPPPQSNLPNLATTGGMSIKMRDGYRFPLAYGGWCRALAALEPDLIEAADPYVPGWAARATANRLGIASIAFYHSDVARTLSMRVGGWVAPIARAYLRRLYSGFDLVLAPSRLMLERLSDAGIHNARLQPLGVDTNTFAPECRSLDVRRKLGLPCEVRLIVYAGRFALEKNIDALIQTARLLGSQYHLLLIGGRASARISSNATVIPYQRNPQRLAMWLASCDVFLHAGCSETYGLVAVEAMACGLPVVAVAQGAVQELVDENVGILSRRAHADDLATAVQAVFAADHGRLSRQARDRAVRRHGWDSSFHRLLTHYETLCRVRPLLPAALESGLAP